MAYETPQEITQILGHAAYVLKGIQSLTDITSYSMTIEHDGVVEEGNFIYGMVSNSVSVGGFQGMKNHDVVLDDGKISGAGTHDRLMATNRIYQEVYKSQQEGATIDG